MKNEHEILAMLSSIRNGQGFDVGDLGIRIDIVRNYPMTLPADHLRAAFVSLRRLTPSGNEGRPTHVITIVDKTSTELLRRVADLLDPDGPEIEL